MFHPHPVSVILVAGGKGLRMGNALPKQFLPLNGKPVLYYAIQTFHHTFPDADLILVLPSEHFSYGNMLLQSFETPIALTIVAGGATRFHSVKNGLQEVKPGNIVFIHDGVRPFIQQEFLELCYQQALLTGSAIPVIPVTDSIRELKGDHSTAINRNNLRAVQTPQVFRAELILPAFEQEYQESFTDEASVAEHYGHNVSLIEGLPQNIKITTPQDLVWAEAMLRDHNI